MNAKTSMQCMTARQKRLVAALLSNSDWISREAIDRLTGASNGPEVIRQLRQLWGKEAIETKFFPRIDRDGLPVRAGHYRFSTAGRQQAIKERACDGEK